jgi:hypothetical protein
MKEENKVVTFAIDPGVNGGYAVIFGSLNAITLHNLDSFGDLLEHVTELEGIHKGFLRAVIEDVPPYAGKNIPSFTTFKLGRSCGQLEGLFRARFIPVEFVSPKKWQSKLTGLKGLQGASRKRALKDHALRLYPTLLPKPSLKTCDALLMAHHFFTHRS